MRAIKAPSSHQPSSQQSQLWSFPVFVVTGVAQQVSPFQALMPSRTAITAIASAASGSAHDQPNRLLRSNPASSTADRYVQSRVCLESATADNDPSSRPARRCAHDNTGMMAKLVAAKAMPIVECWAASIPNRDRTESTVT